MCKGWGTTKLDADMVYDCDGGKMTAFERQIANKVANCEEGGVLVWHEQLSARERPVQKKRKESKKAKSRH